MLYQIFSENEWIYPDSPLSAPGNTAVLYAARGGDVSFQLLTDLILTGREAFSCTCTGLSCEPVLYQLLPVYVSENSGLKVFTTTAYEEVSHFVTRPAPFTLYEITKPLDDGVLTQGRGAFWIRLNISADAVPGVYTGTITLTAGNESIVVPVSLQIYAAQIPPVQDAAFHMVNWIYYPRVAEQFVTAIGSDAYYTILKAFFDNQLDMRNDVLMIPSGEPIRDDSNTVIDFDFSHAEAVGNLALSHGFRKIMGGFVARFINWDDPDNFLLWDREVGCTTIEGYRQLRLYFRRAWECVVKNGWQARYMQCLVDEPQFPNSLAYRALSGICRQNMPGVVINDPVETTDIAGACDIWVVKQAVYEKYLDDFRRLQAMDNEMWLYTCGFPAGATMNRIMDLPLTVSRMPMWLCFKYGCPGFLHWGYHAHTPGEERVDGLIDGCTPAAGRKYPAGNAHVVYVGDGQPWYSVRGHAQRTGAQDYELLYQLSLQDKAKADALVENICRSFDDYDSSAALFDSVRHELLEALG